MTVEELERRISEIDPMVDRLKRSELAAELLQEIKGLIETERRNEEPDSFVVSLIAKVHTMAFDLDNEEWVA